MTSMISGWDIGGAHLKVARCDQNGQLAQIIQVACPLWQGIEQLEKAIESVFKQLNNQDDHTAVTMTGELVDIFADRKSGVGEILACLANYINPDNTLVYAAEKGWLSPEKAAQSWQYVASRNWQASATLAATTVSNGLFIDIGSTTCDIIPLMDGKAVSRQYDDFGRQMSRELLYTGAIRTPLIAISQSAPFNGTSINLAAEVFATTGDIWCLLKEIDANNIQDSSADGQAWDIKACTSRIARLLGTDASEASEQQWIQLAQWFAEQQRHKITAAILHVLSAHADLPLDAPLIGAGVGRFLVKQCAQRLNRPYLDFNELVSSPDNHASDHAPAVAVALLAKQNLS